MHLKMLAAASALLCASCGADNAPVIREVLVVPPVPQEYRTAVSKPEREVRPIAEGGLQDIGLLLTDYDEAVDTANDRITGADAILSDFEARAAKAACEAGDTEACVPPS